jgi:hypothetical protein
MIYMRQRYARTEKGTKGIERVTYLQRRLQRACRMPPIELKRALHQSSLFFRAFPNVHELSRPKSMFFGHNQSDSTHRELNNSIDMQ